MTSAPPPSRPSVEQARALMLAGVGLLDAETVTLDAALGRTLARPIAAARDQPPFDASAMDGWALRREDAAAGARLAIVGESAAGKPLNRPIGPGEAARIFTGAPMPDGADFVVIQEEARRKGDHVLIKTADGPSHVRRRGGDLQAGSAVLQAGEQLDPWRIALAAAAGAHALSVVRRPRIAVLATGDELAEPGAEPLPWQIHNSGGPGLSALIAAWGGMPAPLSAVGDDADAIAQAVCAAPADLIVTIGGASVGDHDLVKPALGQLGLSLVVDTVNVRPGKPTWFGILGDGRRVLGLPGNPAAAFVCAELFLKPLMQAMAGSAPGPALVPAVLKDALPANGPREHWMRAALSRDGEGRLEVETFGAQDSSLVGIFASAGALLPRAAGAGAVPAGRIVSVLQLDRLL